MRILEIAAGSVASARAAQFAGAGRVELCSGLELGGLTPSHAVIARARDALRIPLYVLIRARAGHFLFDASEQESMLADVEHCVRLGCDGVVVGALDADGDVDVVFCGELMRAARGLGVTFHRAFDVARDRTRALEAIIALGCERVLTSGGQRSAWEGRSAIASLVEQGGPRIRIMAGAGVSPENAGPLIAATGVAELHASARAPRPSSVRYQPEDDLGMGAMPQDSDDATIRQLVSAIQAAPAQNV
ncbi:copper homeostasis protein [Luteibacter sp. Sphag1AF]|uniref:copper homeostasis protein CutC n=1 Tax=Luteibacter sp. Sphag1AF TaxID=2587031 RepID=UPI001619D844|nr:copper homeostasis protein CutC [Luteibacter sp. Sphag1AF]MBB3228440.1 copper homeostasis protein [Luteibacter sp. Sphag1AF]